MNKKLARKKFSEQNQFHEEENQFISFTKRKSTLAMSFAIKNQHAASSTNKNQHATVSMNKISFTSTKINEQVSRRGKSTCNNFQAEKSARERFYEQNKFLKKKNQSKINFVCGTCCLLIFVGKSFCMLIFLFVKLVKRYFLLLELILLMKVIVF